MRNTQENYIQESLDDELTPEEELEISGYQPEQVALIDQEFLIQRDSEQAEPIDESENPLIRFAIASLLVVAVGLPEQLLKKSGYCRDRSSVSCAVQHYVIVMLSVMNQLRH